MLSPPTEAAETTNATGGCLILVGPERALKLPSAAAEIAQTGDRIRTDASTCRACAVWRTPNITIEGDGGYAHVKDISCHRKAIWVFYASPVEISNVRFSGAWVRHRNGAGIRWEGYGQLIFKNTWFHNNQMGIIAHDKRQSAMVISDSRFEHNGDCPRFCGHGVYAGRIAHLSIANSQFAGHNLGHHIKSRALVSVIIGNRIMDGATGTANYAINLPDSGAATIRNNYIDKGPLSDNVKALIAIGEEENLRTRAASSKLRTMYLKTTPRHAHTSSGTAEATRLTRETTFSAGRVWGIVKAVNRSGDKKREKS